MTSSYRPGDYSKPISDERDFDYCVNFVIDSLEGGDALVHDTGGKTRFGISSRSHPTINIDNLTRQAAIDIYREEYWLPAGCEMMRWPFNLIVFDAAVNEGVSAAVKMRLACYNWAEMLMERVKHYAEISELPDHGRYFRGWINRCILLYQKAKSA